MRGDKIEIIVEVGTEPRTFWVEATKAGRKVQYKPTRGGFVEVSEVIRTENADPVRTSTFRADRIIALIEHKTEEDDMPKTRTSAPTTLEGTFAFDDPRGLGEADVE